MVEPKREGYLFIGYVGVDTGMMVIGDPGLILPARTEKYSGGGFASYEDAMDALENTRTSGFVEGPQGETIAVAFNAGHGDGNYPVFGKLDEYGCVVEVVIDMAMLDWQKRFFDM